MIIIVSGLPRSGTSLMMQMLKAGGMEVLTDNIRKADEDNPKGYYEFEPVKKTREDPSWLNRAEGKVVKMVSMLLYDLPSDRQYKIIFMKRRMAEVLASQARMLERQGKHRTEEDDRKIGRLFEEHLAEIEEWLAQQKNMEVLYISYNDIISDPLANAQKINRFLGNHLDIEKMSAVVDPALYRQRVSSPTT